MSHSEYKHWTSIDKNPIAPAVLSNIKQQLVNRDAGAIYDISTFWHEVLPDQSLLDIGVVEHTLAFADRPGWKHKHFCSIAKRVVGIDIIPGAVEHLNKIGYDVRLCDATSERDLGERFDIVHIGDVIEHVNEPVKLLQFAKRHLTSGGRIFITTPCPFWWRNILAMIKDGRFVGNADHINWVCPLNALELGFRAGLSLNSYRTIEVRGRNPIRKFIHICLRKLLGRTELFTWAYLFEYTSDAANVD